jgi:hypothetical protein
MWCQFTCCNLILRLNKSELTVLDFHQKPVPVLWNMLQLYGMKIENYFLRLCKRTVTAPEFFKKVLRLWVSVPDCQLCILVNKRHTSHRSHVHAVIVSWRHTRWSVGDRNTFMSFLSSWATIPEVTRRDPKVIASMPTHVSLPCQLPVH